MVCVVYINFDWLNHIGFLATYAVIRITLASYNMMSHSLCYIYVCVPSST